MSTGARLAVLMGVFLLLGGCSTARIEETSDDLGASGPRGGVVSYTGGDQAGARALMSQYCGSEGYRAAMVGQRSEQWMGRKSWLYAQDRTYVRFECIDKRAAQVQRDTEHK